MPQAALSYNLDDQEVHEKIRKILAGLSDLTPLMQTIGEIGVASIQRNFEKGGRPQEWQSLAESTEAKRIKVGTWPGDILVGRGTLKKITYQADKRKVTLFPPDEPHAAIHHFGGKAGRGRKVTIPAREYMLLQHEDHLEIEAVSADFAFKHLSSKK